MECKFYILINFYFNAIDVCVLLFFTVIYKINSAIFRALNKPSP